MAQSRNAQQRRILKRAEAEQVCPFCSKDFFWNFQRRGINLQTKYWLLTDNHWPYEGTRVHILAISLKHIESLSEISMRAGYDLIKALRWTEKELGIESGALVMRFGEPGVNGGTIRHLHFHIISGDYKNPEAPKVRVKVSDPTAYRPEK